MPPKKFSAELTKFKAHKSRLLELLYNGHASGPKHFPFDRDKSWLYLDRFASFYLRNDDSDKQWALERVPNVKRLSDLVEHLGHACDLLRHGTYGDVGSDVFTAWSSQIIFSQKASLEFMRSKKLSLDEFNRSLVALAKLNVAACAAADSVRRNPGRPKGPSVLPSSDVIIGLASVYRRCTGSKPGAGTGAFAEFSKGCLVALGKTGVKKGSLVNAIKRARKDARVYADRNGMSSPFD